MGKINGVRKNRRRRMLRKNRFCVYCGERLTLQTSTVDHVIPKSKGGNNGKKNTVISCKPCNKKKGDKVDD